MSIGKELPGPGLMSFSSTVFVSSPKVLHSSTPLVPSSAEKIHVPRPTRAEGEESPEGLMSFSSVVPSVVPSVTQGSMPVVPSFAAKKMGLPQQKLTRLCGNDEPDGLISLRSPKSGPAASGAALVGTAPGRPMSRSIPRRAAPATIDRGEMRARCLAMVGGGRPVGRLR